MELRSGAELEADIIVTATGLRLKFLGGVELTVFPKTYEKALRAAQRAVVALRRRGCRASTRSTACGQP